MEPKKPDRHDRRKADQTTLTISLPKSLKTAIEEAAAEETRSTSNYLVKELTALMEEKKQTKKTQGSKSPTQTAKIVGLSEHLGPAAEDPAHYGSGQDEQLNQGA